nr:MAG TPA: hypothetical protein [Caudoviricetes sp.]
MRLFGKRHFLLPEFSDRCFFLSIGYRGRIWYNEATKRAMIS